MSLKAPIAIDLFAGPGGLSSGFCEAGFSIAAWVEKNPHACKTLRANHEPEGTLLSRVIEKPIQSVTKQELDERLSLLGATRPDVIIGGPPCQGFSRSNKMSRTADNPVNALWEHFLQVVSWYMPPLVLMENVDDMRRFNQGAVFANIRESFGELGYTTVAETLNSAHFGVPQVRNRIVIAATLPHVTFEYPARTHDAPQTVWDAISDLPALDNGNLVDQVEYRTDPTNSYQRGRRSGSCCVSNNVVTKNGRLVLERYAHIPQGGNWRNIPDHLMQNYADKERTHNWIYRRLQEDKPSVTITNFRKSMLIHPREDRGLSVREAARLQSFKDSYVIRGSILHQQQQVADAVPPLLAEALALSARQALNL